MGRKMKDLTGERFGKLTVVSFDNRRNNRTYWKCICDCGGNRIVSNDHLKNGDITDCGCYKKHIAHWKKHGMYNSRIYRIWSLMKERCYNEKRKDYNNYGGRGIKVCNEWLDSSTFIDWSLNNGYEDDLTLDRIDNNGDYCPQNCRWITAKEQGANKRNNRFITHNDITKTITQWANDNGLSYYVLKKRIDVLGWSFERAITEPVHLNVSNEKRGEKQNGRIYIQRSTGDRTKQSCKLQ